MPAAAEAEPVLVKRYARNRLYDTAHRCYVSLDQLREWVDTDVVFSVVDSETGEDVRAVVLA